MVSLNTGILIKRFYNQVISSNRINIILLAILCCCSFILRVLPLFSIHGDIFNYIDPYDSLYLLRQVELVLANFPSYNSFEPMTFFPAGQNIHWGPLLAVIVAAACLAAGASTSQEIASVAVLVGPLLGILVIPLAYLIGARLHNRFSGILAALFVAVLPGNFFDVSSFGIIDHHVMEALLGCAFILSYLVTLQVSWQPEGGSPGILDNKKILFASALCGFVYLAGYLNMGTMIIFALVALVFTAFQAIIDVHGHRDLRYLVIVNSIVFAIALAGSLLFIQDRYSFSLVDYSIGHAVACLFIIVATWVLYLLSVTLRKRPFILYPAVIITFLAGAAAATALLVPRLYYTVVSGLVEGLGRKTLSVTIIESLPMDPATLWSEYNVGLVLFSGGLAILCWKVWKTRTPGELLCLTWGVLFFLLALQHIRYDYLLTAPFAVISAYCAGFILGENYTGDTAPGSRYRDRPQEPGDIKKQPGKMGKKSRESGRKGKTQPGKWRDVLVAGVVVLSIVFVGASVWNDIHKEPVKPQEGWMDALAWLKANTPEPGINYYRNYPSAGFKYPPEAYGVMSWWDYGHMITFFAHRIPNTNPFQSGLLGPAGGAAFFMSGNETDAVKMLKTRGSRYVITDYPMAVTKFWAIATWHDSTNKTSPYILTLETSPASGTHGIQVIQFLTPAYFSTMVTRLQLFDGSGVVPSEVVYVEYLNRTGKATNPTISYIEETGWDKARSLGSSRKEGQGPGMPAALLSRNYSRPSTVLPALGHFRLIYESPEIVTKPVTVNRVKIFELVKGARVNGSGLIVLDLETNTGRRFQYVQESSDGQFILPYATDMPNGAVRALGPYRFLPANITLDVPETAVVNGLPVN